MCFDDYINTYDFNQWKDFKSFILNLGFKINKPCLYPSISIAIKLSPKDYVDVYINSMEHSWTLNQIGCYIYARYYTLLHSTIQYDKEKEEYFFHQALLMLERRLKDNN